MKAYIEAQDAPVGLSDSEATFRILYLKRPSSQRGVLSVSQGMRTPLLLHLFAIS